MNRPALQQIERRDSERRAFRSTAYILLANREPIPVRTVDISPSGLGIVASANPPPQTFCVMRISIPRRSTGLAQTFNVQTRVVHSVLSREHDGFKIGLVFIEPSDVVVTAIRDFLS